MKFQFVKQAACMLLLACAGNGLVFAQGQPSFNESGHNPFTKTIAAAIGREHKDRGLDFVENKNQWVANIKFKANIPGGAMFLTGKGFVYHYVDQADLDKGRELRESGNKNSKEQLNKLVVHHYAYKVNFIGANSEININGEQKRENYNNYIIGNDRSKWAGHVPIYGAVTQEGVYDGINVVVYSKNNAPKYDFIVAPQADPAQIKLGFEGVHPKLTKGGDIRITTTFNEILEKAPVAYQMINGEKVDVPVQYELKKGNITFAFPSGYNQAYTLVIDPELVYCTYANGQDDYSFATTYDYDGCTLIGGQAWETGWPVTIGAFQTTYVGGTIYPWDVCINKYNPLGSDLIFSTYFGGNGADLPHSLRVNSQNELYIVGSTESSDLPYSVGCFDSTLNGSVDIFVAHLSYDGSQLLGGTYIGGSGEEPLAFSTTGTYERWLQNITSPVEIQFDTLGNAWIVGNTASTDFPVTTNAQQSNFNGGTTDGVVFKINPTCSQLIYSSYLGGSSTDALYSVQLNSNQDVIVAGFSSSVDYPTTDSALHPTFIGQWDGVVTILNPQNGTILKSTYLGFATTNDIAIQLQVDDSNDIYVMGYCSGDYTVSANVYSVPFGHTFIDKLSSDLKSSLLSTVVGGGSYYADGFLLDVCGNIYVTGLNAPPGLPTTPDAYKATGGTGPGVPYEEQAPFWFCVLKPHFAGLIYGSYFGVSGDHTHCGVSRLDPEGIVYHSICNAKQYPDTTAGAYQTHYSGLGQDIVTFKFDFQATGVRSHIVLPPGGRDTGCAPYTLNLNNASTSPYAIDYTWDPGDGSPEVHTTGFTHTYDSPGVYEVILHAHSDSACITDDYDTFKLTVVKVEYPQITVTPDTLLCNLETSLKLWVNIENPTPNNHIQWYPPQGIISGANQDTATVDPTINTYYVIVLDSIPGFCGYIARDTVHIDFYPRALNINTNDTSVCKGTQVQVDAEAAQGYTFTWSPSTDVNDTTALNPVITANQTETYTLTAHHPGCLDTAQTLTINVQDIPVVDVGNDIKLCQWQQVALSANITPYRDDYVYQWTPSAGLDNPNSPNAHFNADTSGWYYLSVETPIGCAGTDSVYVTVFPGNFGAVAEDTGFCQPNVAHLWASGGVHYKWEPADGLSNDSIANPVASPNATIRYTVYMQDIHGCKDTGDVLVSVFPSAVLNLPDSISVYPGESYHLQPGTNCVYFDWFPSSGVNSTSVSDPIFNPAVRTRYFVTARTENGCEIKDSMDVLVKSTVLNLPNAFTPGSGANGIFKVNKRGIAKLKDFSVYNRWGNKIFTTTNINEGWDGTYNGKPQPTGVYVYTIEAVTVSGENIVKQGNVTLIR